MEGKFADHLDEKEKCLKFLSEFKAPSANVEEQDIAKYKDMMQEVSNRERVLFPISLDDVLAFKGDDSFVQAIQRNTKRYMEIFAEAVDELLPSPTVQIDVRESVAEVLLHQRMQQQRQANSGEGPSNQEAVECPEKELTRTFQVTILPVAKVRSVALREVRAADIGRLVRVKGLVTRISDVKPLVTVVTYSCDACGWEAYQQVNAKTFMPKDMCETEQCKTNKTAGKLFMQTRGSKFIKYQELKLQETPDQVPMGHIPRTLTVLLKGELTRQCGPGNIVTVSGIFLPQRLSGFQAIKAGIIADTYIEATAVERHKKNYNEIEKSNLMETKLQQLLEQEDSYSTLARSLAPEIYGHEDVKKALLLLLVGGATKSMKDGMKIRGDINICLMGDPGVAKSQLLKHIAGVAPRGVYTTGKGSSGVGLTAAVVKDKMTGELTLEGGALVLADKGVCCIDEFDKMEDADRTAIHEVMEQQSVSIAKAGITTTLNARTSVLAAANPIYGRYNLKLSASKNINLPNALLSRFDLLFLLLDKADRQSDMALARHVTHVHRYRRNPDMDFTPVDPKLIQYYISQARDFCPVIPEDLTHYIVEAYVELRQQDHREMMKAAKSETERENCGQTAMTARQLLSILRLSQALARLRFSQRVSTGDVDEAIRLVHVSKSSILDDADADDGRKSRSDPITAVFNIIKDFAESRRKSIRESKSKRKKGRRDREGEEGEGAEEEEEEEEGDHGGSGFLSVNYGDIEPIVITRGFTIEQLKECIATYADLDVWQMTADKSRLVFL